jgi:FkbM family methyltransferase
MSNADPLKNRVYYSQNREDLILESFFPGVEKGFYVDVGASDPDKYSVTKLFYEKGWNGINAEPIKHHYKALKQKRPRDINLNIGIGHENSELVFHEYTSGDGLSTFSTDATDRDPHFKEDIYKDVKKYKIKVRTLKDIFESHKVKVINFLKVDVEGFEYEVLSGNDWKKFRPEVVCIEADRNVSDWHLLLESNGYKAVFDDGLNEYYIDTKTAIAEKFDFVGNVILHKDGGIRSSDYEHITDLRKDIEQKIQEIQAAHLRLQSVLAENAQNNKLYQDLLAENHNNHARAVIAERALRSPGAFIKYELKRLHRAMVRILGAKKPTEGYSKYESDAKSKALNKLANAKSDQQLLLATQELAKLETERLERISKTSGNQPLPLKIYLRIVRGIKRLRMRSIS